MTGTNAFAPSRSKPEKLKHPLAMRKVVKYPDKLGERISTQIKVRPDQKQVRWLCVDLLDSILSKDLIVKDIILKLPSRLSQACMYVIMIIFLLDAAFFNCHNLRAYARLTAKKTCSIAIAL